MIMIIPMNNDQPSCTAVVWCLCRSVKPAQYLTELSTPIGCTAHLYIGLQGWAGFILALALIESTPPSLCPTYLYLGRQAEARWCTFALPGIPHTYRLHCAPIYRTARLGGFHSCSSPNREHTSFPVSHLLVPWPPGRGALVYICFTWNSPHL